MRIRRRSHLYLQGKDLAQKAKLFKRNAFYNGAAGAVFVLDTEGDHRAILRKLVKGRDSTNTDFPMAVGVAHPCIEAWLLADGAAIAAAFGLPGAPTVPDAPEGLPAPQKNRAHNPKTVLAACAGARSVSAQGATRIAIAMTDTVLVRQRCPLSFELFAKEVEERIAPIFA
jgi:hypothetical protein